ncbi:MAG: lytic transglycosylase domain-containing protein [Rhodospirillales bacterium]|nr:lytic transglycosylase domain-containing protein [Rhodospirillales bacterium]MDE2574413.1 lytic transglycosylase domain-containing protein [Rhodospirillales bacterium]
MLFRRSGLQSSPALLRGLLCLAAVALLSACASHGPRLSATQEAARYAALAKHNYAPPGPPGDPWGPYIVEAAAKYDVPETWVRSVMHQESGGRLYEGGQLIVSSAGAMGLMQVMPETYDELRARYGLGDDPYDPHDNIMAGTAYLRELYDMYGSPGFLAAYNAGPGRLDDYLTHNRPLPDETRRYVARVGTAIGDSTPLRPSPATQLAMNQIPINIPPGPRYPRRFARGGAIALADNRGARTGYSRGVVTAATLPEPPRPARPPVVMAAAAPKPRGGFHLISPAMADTLPTQPLGTLGGGGGWAIQVGAFANPGQARHATEIARAHAHQILGLAQVMIGTVHAAHGTLYRARLTGLSRDAAVRACERLTRDRSGCIVLSPDAQS